MNTLTNQKRCEVIAALVEGNSIRATVRMTGAAKNTVVKLLADMGAACSEYQDRVMRDLPCRHIQCGEIWSFCYAKQKNVPDDKLGEFGYGDVWTWTALDPDTKLVPCWLVGLRDAGYATEFIGDVAKRLHNRIQLTTEGHKVHLEAVEGTSGADIDYAMLIKVYGTESKTTNEVRYSPAECTGTQQTTICARPDPKHISTSFVERQNLTKRMFTGRFTRQTDAFSRKIENLEAAVALHFMHYSFCRIHQSLRVTPAMEAGISDHVWEIAEIVALLKKQEPN